MTHLIANELHNKGFKVSTFGTNVLVSLTNRKVSTMEVKQALINHEAQLTIVSTSTGAMVVL